ncbi:hypothetical protein ACFQU5_11630 [Ureibacillus sp. GCM10028918]
MRKSPVNREAARKVEKATRNDEKAAQKKEKPARKRPLQRIIDSK